VHDDRRGVRVGDDPERVGDRFPAVAREVEVTVGQPTLDV
jgi:hypothetical protein